MPGPVRSSRKRPWVRARWARRPSGPRLSIAVAPPARHGTLWSMSQDRAGTCPQGETSYGCSCTTCSRIRSGISYESTAVPSRVSITWVTRAEQPPRNSASRDSGTGPCPSTRATPLPASRSAALTCRWSRTTGRSRSGSTVLKAVARSAARARHQDRAVGPASAASAASGPGSGGSDSGSSGSVSRPIGRDCCRSDGSGQSGAVGGSTGWSGSARSVNRAAASAGVARRPRARARRESSGVSSPWRASAPANWSTAASTCTASTVSRWATRAVTPGPGFSRPNRTKRCSRAARDRASIRAGAIRAISPSTRRCVRVQPRPGITGASTASSSSACSMLSGWAIAATRRACQARTCPASTSRHSRGWRCRRSRASAINSAAEAWVQPNRAPSSIARNSGTRGVPSPPSCAIPSPPGSGRRPPVGRGAASTRPATRTSSRPSSEPSRVRLASNSSAIPVAASTVPTPGKPPGRPRTGRTPPAPASGSCSGSRCFPMPPTVEKGSDTRLRAILSSSGVLTNTAPGAGHLG